MVDGQIIRFDDPALSPLTFVSPLDILRIEFIIDAGQASIFGVQAPTGVMIVYTRSGNFLDYVNRKEGGLNFKGYEPVLDFETYLLERKKDRRLRNSPSPTLYWNPSVETDKNGEAVIRLKAPETSDGVVLSIETLTPDGRVGSFQRSFKYSGLNTVWKSLPFRSLMTRFESRISESLKKTSKVCVPVSEKLHLPPQ